MNRLVFTKVRDCKGIMFKGPFLWKLGSPSRKYSMDKMKFLNSDWYKGSPDVTGAGFGIAFSVPSDPCYTCQVYNREKHKEVFSNGFLLSLCSR